MEIEPCTTADEYQRKVIDWAEGEVVVAAAAGSGKSFCLIERSVELLRRGTLPAEFVTLVYNRSAADQFKARLKTRLGANLGEQVQIYTFHGWAYSLLRAWFAGSGAFNLNRIIGTDGGPAKPKLVLTAMKALSYNGEWKDYAAASELIRESCIDLAPGSAAEEISRLPCAAGSISAARRLLAFTVKYQAIKSEAKAIDFADMLWIVCEALKHEDDPAVQALAQKYTHVMIDEGQDCNAARSRIGSFLGEHAKSLMWVADFRQSIYAFNGARPDLLKARLDAGATLLTLPVNRRSTRKIVEAANALAEGQEWNLGGACAASEGKPEGAPVAIWPTASAWDEAHRIADDIAARISTPERELDLGALLTAEKKARFVVLCRTHAQAAPLEAAFLVAGLPCRHFGAEGGIWKSALGRDVLGFLYGAADVPNEDVVRAANRGGRRIKHAVVESVLQACRSRETSLLSALKNASRDNGMPDGQMRMFGRELERLSKMKWPDRCAAICDLLVEDAKIRAEEAGGIGHADADEDLEAAYKNLTLVASRTGSLEALEEAIATVQKVTAKGPAVEISTVHRAKGLQWPVVYIAGCLDGVFPHAKSTDWAEEHRLFYVALTRAEEEVICSIGGRAISGEDAEDGTEPPEGCVQLPSVASPFLAALPGVWPKLEISP